MSWDAYVDSMVGYGRDPSGTDHVDQGCIIGLDGGAKWTTDAHPKALKITPQEAAQIAKCFKSGDFTPFMSGGIWLEGQKYQFLREEDKKVMYGKKKTLGAITLQTSKTAIVIGHCPEGSQHGNCNKAVAQIAEYLESTGI